VRAAVGPGSHRARATRNLRSACRSLHDLSPLVHAQSSAPIKPSFRAPGLRRAGGLQSECQFSVDARVPRCSAGAHGTPGAGVRVASCAITTFRAGNALASRPAPADGRDMATNEFTLTQTQTQPGPACSRSPTPTVALPGCARFRSPTPRALRRGPRPARVPRTLTSHRASERGSPK
jgi:hypothetical protein